MGITASVFATSPPKESGDAPLLIPPSAKAPRKAADVKEKEVPVPLDAKAIEAMHIDGNLKQSLLDKLSGADKKMTEAPATPENADTSGLAASSDGLTLATNTTIVGASQTTNDTNEDYEPAIIVNQFSGVNRATTVFMKYDTGTMNPNLHFRTTTDFVNFTGGALPLPTGHTRSADPMLAENYSTSGAFPKRTYCVGVSLQFNTLGQYTNGALNVWHTDNPGTTAWTLTTIDTASSPTILDKPSIWTSWASGSLGYTYVAAIATGSPNRIRVYRKTTTNTWTMVNNSITGTGIQSPIILVDVNTGYVYLLWQSESAGTISIARSTDMGVNFGTPVSFSAGPMVSGSGNICDASSGNCMRGTTVIMARPNATDNSIGVVWHRRDSTSSNDTDVYFNAFDYATQSWRGAVRVNDVTTGDQWNPGLDPDANGNYLVTWYDRRDDSNDLLYRTYSARIDASGNALETSNVLLHTSARASDPRQFPADSGGRRYMGEYQDVWEWLGKWYVITMYAPDPNNGGNGQADLYLVRVQP